MDPQLRARIAGAVGPVATVGRVSGGDFAEAYAVELVDGGRVFAKTHRRPPPEFFSTEAAGLRWLREAEALPVPQVLAVLDDDPAGLILEWVDEGGRSDEADFGRRLATLHAAGAPAFGRSDGRTTGSLALPNEPCPTWADFYATRRLLPLARIAADRGALPASSIGAIESVADQLDRYGAADEAPARIHGDLWAGNRLVDRQGRSWLVDPAAHGGHREFDLAMMRLFGGYGDAAFRSYDEVAPLADGWEDRIDLHQLAPLIVHAIKFGGGYVAAVDGALGRLA